MIRAGEMIPGGVYRKTRNPGNAYCTVLATASVQRLGKRLARKPMLALRGDEARVLRAIERGHMIVELYVRYIDDKGKRQEARLSRFGLAPTERINAREVQSKPGYVTKAAA